MSPLIHYCVLCGHSIGHHGDMVSPSAWDYEYRILYTHHDELAVSGVGVADDDWGALGLDPPLDFNERFDTTSEPGTHIKVSRNDLEDGQHGYPFHEACWALLEKTWAPEPVPVRRLFDACLSLPWSGHAGNFTWDHDYGGVVFRRMGYSPWEDVHCVQDVPCGRADPYLSPEIQKLPHLTPTLEGAPQEGAIATRKGHDIFAHLPFEIVLHVATYLPTPDYLNARRALRALYPVFYTNHFWRSRFGPGGERDWIFEAPVWQVSCDWLSIYRRTQHGSPDMENRQRLWKLASILKGILSPQWMEPEEGDINTTSGMDMDSCVSEVTGNIEKASHQLLEGCRRFHQRQAPVSTDLSRIAFSVIRSCDVTYISGLRLIMASGRDIPLGYISDQEEVVDVATLTGLRVAAGSRGIRAIQCIAGEKTFPWIGCPDDVPMTERLIFEEPITGINAGFDAYKMVSIAARCEGRHERDDLRHVALWYPRIPEPSLNLNTDTFIPKQNVASMYEPLCWTMFGGPGGSHLNALTGMSVFRAKCTIEFHYNNDDIPAECRTAGCWPHDEYDIGVHFDIDGPGGEVIDSLTVLNYEHDDTDDNIVWFFKPGYMESLEISTNRGRKCNFVPDAWDTRVRDDGEIRPRELVAGTAIHGIYWTYHDRHVMAIGAITEKTDTESA